MRAVALKCDAPSARPYMRCLSADARALLKLLSLDNYELSLVLTGDSAIRELNRAFRGKDRSTDVLSFPQLEECLDNETEQAALHYKTMPPPLAGCGKTISGSMCTSRFRTLGKRWLPSFSSLPLAGEITEGEAGCEDFFSSLLGDVVISVDTALRQAKRLGITPESRLRTLLIHGVLHLLGYDHEKSRVDARRMFARERELAAGLALCEKGFSRWPSAAGIEATEHR